MRATLLISILILIGTLPGPAAALTVPGDTIYYPMGFQEQEWVTTIETSPDPAGFYSPTGHIVGFEMNLRSTAREGVNFTIRSDIWNMSGNMTKGLIFSKLKLAVTDPQGDLTYYEKKWISHSGLRLQWSATRGEMEAHRLGLLGNNTLFPNPTYINLTTKTQGYIIIHTVDDLGYEVLRDAVIDAPQTWFEELKYGAEEVAGDIGALVWAAILLIMPNEWEAPFTDLMGFILNAMKWTAFLILNFWLLVMAAVTLGLMHAIILTRRNRKAYRIMRMYQILVRDVRGFLDWFFGMILSIGALFISMIRILRG
jgi:hypothetical protein